MYFGIHIGAGHPSINWHEIQQDAVAHVEPTPINVLPTPTHSHSFLMLHVGGVPTGPSSQHAPLNDSHVVPTPLNVFPVPWHWHCGLTVHVVPSQHAPSLQACRQSASVGYGAESNEGLTPPAPLC
jgi:hypothetical protein